MEFNVPQSGSNGSPQHPGVEDQYLINVSSIIKHNNGFGDDWAIFDVFSNSQTGLTAIEAQNAYYDIEQSNGGSSITITGYGGALSELNKTQQTDTGTNEGRFGNVIKYAVDTDQGNSGSPVIDISTGKVIGIHTTASCPDSGFNFGTSFFNNAFWDAAYSTLFEDVAINQFLMDGQSQAGTVGRWDGTDFLPRFITPETLSLMVKTTEIFHADTAIYSGEKYNNWNNENDVTNHHVFDIEPDFQNSLNANFEPTNGGITINTQLISAPGQSGGQIKFKDPWLIDFPDPAYGNNLRNQGMNAPLIPYGAPLNITTNSAFKGVFLNQNPDPNDPTVPYYSVRAEDQTINGIDYFLDHWSGSGVSFQNPNSKTTAVVFTASNATVTATMKGHLVSAESGALAGNNQRKIVYDNAGNYHLVYEENGEIYYTVSGNNGAIWANEVRLSDGSGDNQSPSIDVADGTIIPVVVWQKESSAIRMRRKVGGSWQSIQTVANVYAPSGFKATPVVMSRGCDDVVVWRHYDPLYGSATNLRVRAFNDDQCFHLNQDAFGDTLTIPSTNSNSIYPSLAEDRFGNLHLAWAESGKIYYSKFDHYYDPVTQQEAYNFSITKEEVSQYSGYSNHVFPSISVDFDIHAQVMWQAYSGPALESQIILHRWRSSGSGGRAWGAFASFIGNENYVKPSIMSYPGINNQKRRATWAREGGAGNLIWAAKYDGGSWTDFYQWMNGVDPNISTNPTGTEAVKEVYRGTGSAPYQIATTSDNLLKTTGENFVRRRRGVIGYGDSEIVFEAGEFEVAGNAVKLFDYADTLLIGQSGKWEEMFRTEPVWVSDEDVLSYFQGFETLNPDELTETLPGNAKIRFLLEVVDAAKNKMLATLDEQKITRNHIPADSRVRKEFVLNVNTRTEVFFRVQVRLRGDLSISQSMVEAHYETGVDSLARSVSDQPFPVALTPKTFALS